MAGAQSNMNIMPKKGKYDVQLDPVNQIPHAAPTIERPNPKATPKLANPYGDMWVNISDHPWLQNGEPHIADEEELMVGGVTGTR